MNEQLKAIYVEHYLTEQYLEVWKKVKEISPSSTPEKYRLNKNSDVEVLEFLVAAGLDLQQFETASFRKEILVDNIYSGLSVLGYIKRQNMMTVGLSLQSYIGGLLSRFELLTREVLPPKDYDHIVYRLKEKNFI